MARPDPLAPSSQPSRPADLSLLRLWLARAWWLGPVLAALALAVLYAGALRTGFLNDDYIFLEQARTQSVPGALLGPGPIGNYFRPLSRQLYFAALTPLAGGQPLIFHAANFTIFLAALALLFDLLAGLLPLGAAAAGTLYFALLPLQRVNLTWVSCSQDLLALALALAALALYRRKRIGMALAATLGALASKEIALGLPGALLAWSLFIERLRPRAAFRRTLPFVALSAVWGALGLRLAFAAAPADGGLHFDPGHFLAALIHAVQSLLGLENPTGILRALTARGPAPLPLVLIAVLALWLPARGANDGKSNPRAIAGFAAAWVLGFALLTGPVAGIWSGYFYTVPAVGGAVLVGLLLRRAGRPAWLILVPLLLWWHEGGTGPRAFAVRENPWGWTSHLTSATFDRAARLTSDLSSQLRQIEPAPPRGGRLFFATLPPWAGFQNGNGALVRALYRDPSLESYFFSQFDESTAGAAPCRFFWWDGAALKPLYREVADPFFQVGADLLLLDQPAGAVHAFHRALAAGGYRPDDLYWLGWAELWNGRRDEAEAAWRALGAADDTMRWRANMAAARLALVSLRDTLEGRRTLVEAIRYGMGRPEPHGVLGGLLLARQPKYAMLELKVATTLNPDDWQSRRALLAALLDAHLVSSARRELDALLARSPGLATDPIVVRARRALGTSDEPTSSVFEF